MSELLKNTKMLELHREYTTQDGRFDFAEYQVTGDLRLDILKKLDRDSTLLVMLQERTFVETFVEYDVENYRVYVYVLEGEKKDCVFVGSESEDPKAINRELFNWVLGRS